MNINNIEPKHALLKLEGVPVDFLEDEVMIKHILLSVAHNINATVVKYDSVKFNPQGLTIYIVLAESHISIHTFPEIKTCWIDIFTCTDKMECEYGIRLIKQYIPHSKFESQLIKR